MIKLKKELKPRKTISKYTRLCDESFDLTLLLIQPLKLREENAHCTIYIINIRKVSWYTLKLLNQDLLQVFSLRII